MVICLIFNVTSHTRPIRCLGWLLIKGAFHYISEAFQTTNLPFYCSISKIRTMVITLGLSEHFSTLKKSGIGIVGLLEYWEIIKRERLKF